MCGHCAASWLWNCHSFVLQICYAIPEFGTCYSFCVRRYHGSAKRKHSDWLGSIGSRNSCGDTSMTDSPDENHGGLASPRCSRLCVRRVPCTAAEVLKEIMDDMDSPESDGETTDGVTASQGEPSSSTFQLTSAKNVGRLENSVCRSSSKVLFTPRKTPRQKRLVSRTLSVSSMSDIGGSPPLNASPAVSHATSESPFTGASCKGFYGSAKSTPLRSFFSAKSTSSTPGDIRRIAGQRRVLEREKACLQSPPVVESESSYSPKDSSDSVDVNLPSPPIIQLDCDDAETSREVAGVLDDNSLSQTSPASPAISTPPPSDTASSTSADEGAPPAKKLFPIFYMQGKQPAASKRSTFLKWVRFLFCDEDKRERREGGGVSDQVWDL